MADHKPDVLGSTGAHSAWVGERVAPGSPLRPPPLGREGARNWTNNATPAHNTRHSAITKSLFNFPSYKSWTEKVKSNWQKDAGPDKEQEETK